MEIKAFFGILASIIALVGSITYIKDIYHKKVHPHVLSWFGWSFIMAVGSAAMFASGATWVTLIFWTEVAICLFIALYSLYKKVGVWSVENTDYILFGLGVIGIVLWQLLNLPIIALVCVILADACFGIPTIIKTLKDPTSETKTIWIATTLSKTIALLSITAFTFSEAAYLVYLVGYDLLVLLIIFKVIRYKTITKH